MNNRSFSSRLTWRIIGVVSVIFLLTFLVAGWTYQRLIAGKSIPEGVIIVSLLLLILVGLVVIFFVCRRETRRMTRPITELSVSALNMAKGNFGDLYDFILHGDCLHFAVGDVSGKGVPASIMMAIKRATLHFMAGLGLPLHESIGRINK